MGCSRTRTSAAESDHLPDLVKAAQWLPDVLDVTPDWQGVRVDFPESEFLINTKDDAASAQCCVKFSAVLRAEPPGLQHLVERLDDDVPEDTGRGDGTRGDYRREVALQAPPR